MSPEMWAEHSQARRYACLCIHFSLHLTVAMTSQCQLPALLDCDLELEARQYPPSGALSEYLTQHLPRELEDSMMSWAYPVLHSTHSFHGILLYYKFSLRILLKYTFLLEKKTKIEIIVSLQNILKRMPFLSWQQSKWRYFFLCNNFALCPLQKKHWFVFIGDISYWLRKH